MIYALINPQNGIDRRSANIDPTVQTKASWKWLPVVEVGNTAFDPALRKKTGPVTSVGASQVTDTYTVVDLSAQELDDIKTAKVSAIDMLQFEVAFDMENRMRAKESLGAITRVQYRTALKNRIA